MVAIAKRPKVAGLCPKLSVGLLLTLNMTSHYCCGKQGRNERTNVPSPARMGSLPRDGDGKLRRNSLLKLLICAYVCFFYVVQV